MPSHKQPPSVMTTDQTPDEKVCPSVELQSNSRIIRASLAGMSCEELTRCMGQHNIEICKEYMAIAYSPTENKGGDSVRHLCHDDSWFWAPATFPGCETPMDYAQSHSVVMASVADLHILRFDQVFAKNGHVLLRYTAEGSHCGKPYKGTPASGNHARWSAAAIFEVEDSKIKSFTKDWDQKTMQVRKPCFPLTTSS